MRRTRRTSSRSHQRSHSSPWFQSLPESQDPTTTISHQNQRTILPSSIPKHLIFVHNSYKSIWFLCLNNKFSLSLCRAPTSFFPFYNIMPVAASCCREKGVLVTVYVEKPRRSFSQNNHHRRLPQEQQPYDHRHHHNHHHHHQQQPIKQRRAIHNPNKDGGYDRRAHLLQYSHELRQSAHHPSKFIPIENPQEKQITRLPSQRRHTPTCFGNWKKLILPNFLGSFLDNQAKKVKKKKKHESEPTTQKIKAMVKSIDRKLNITSKLLSVFRRRR